MAITRRPAELDDHAESRPRSRHAASRPAPPEPAARQTASLLVESRPSGATVFIDGKRDRHDADGDSRRCRVGSHAVRIEMSGYRPLDRVGSRRRRARRTGRGVAGAVRLRGRRGSRGRRRESQSAGTMEAVLALEDGTCFSGARGRRRRRSPRRGRVQHEHDRLSGSADRSVLRRPDRHDDLRRDRQLRRVAGRRRVAQAAGGRVHHSRRVAGREQLARRRRRCATISSPTASSPSPTSTRAR